MFDAYIKKLIAGKLPLQIECITSQELTLYAATSNGLLTYKADLSDQNDFTPQVCKSFTKRQAIQIEVVPQFNILISLSDGILNVHDCLQVNFPIIGHCALSKVKNSIAYFAVNIGIVFFTFLSSDSLTLTEFVQDDALSVFIVARRRIHIFNWNNGTKTLDEITPFDIILPDSPKCVVPCGQSVALAIRDEYFLVKLDPKKDGQQELPRQPEALLSISSRGNNEAFIFTVPEFQLLGFLYDERTVFRTYSGDVVSSQPEITWSAVPNSIVYDRPYLIAILQRSIEIRTLRPTILVQTIDIQRAKCISVGSRSLIYCASVSDIWVCCASSNLHQNIQSLLSQKQYELAIQLAENIRHDRARTDLEASKIQEDKNNLILQIKSLYAFHLFTLKSFAESFRLYNEIEAEIIYVVSLFPELLPAAIRGNVSFPGDIPTSNFQESDWQHAYRALQDYLSEVRTSLARAVDHHSRNKIELTAEQLKEKKEMLQIVDTTLLKCYLHTNDMLISSLLRLKDNSCNVTECERVLEKAQKYAELFLLYQVKNKHDEALTLLQKHSKLPQSRLNGAERTVAYLQDIGAERLDLVFKYSKWVLREKPDFGLLIFIEDTGQEESLPREKVLEFLRREFHRLVIPYLEHVIIKWADQSPKFHDTLAEYYVTTVKDLMAQYLNSLPEGHQVAVAGMEPDELGELRRKLLTFLKGTSVYTADLVLVQIPPDALYEERAILLGRLGRHEQAIAIYTNILLDNDQAEKYCVDNYVASDPHRSELFLLLLRMYAAPPDNTLIGLMQSRLPKPKPNVSLALRVLSQHASQIDAVKAVELLPDEMGLAKVWCALEKLLQQTSVGRRGIIVQRGLFYAQCLRVQSHRMHAQMVKLAVTYKSECEKCRKKIGNSAFARLPNGSLIHYWCYKEPIRTDSVLNP